MASSILLLPSYLLSQENVRELIKIEEMDPISTDDGHCLSGGTEDSKDLYTFCGNNYMAYESEMCSTLIESQTQFIAHRNPHTTEKPYTCDDCNKQFSQKANLRQHKVIHTGEKAFECAECSKRFSQSSTLKIHQVIHTQAKK